MITKRIRFEVFKRDGFQCVYCGRTPPEVILELDHIEPISEGGKDDINNFITSCFDCNRGKGKIVLDKIPAKLVENLEILKLKEQQIKEYRQFIKKIERKLEKDIEEIENVFTETYQKRLFVNKFKEGTLKRFLKLLPLHEILEAMNIACSKFNNNPEQTIRYFCGICWNKTRGTKPKEPEDEIIKLWEKYSIDYRRGIGFYRLGDIKKIINYDIKIIEISMIAALSGERQSNYWDKFMELLKKDIENEAINRSQ